MSRSVPFLSLRIFKFVLVDLCGISIRPAWLVRDAVGDARDRGHLHREGCRHVGHCAALVQDGGVDARLAAGPAVEITHT